jgi:hypothetical protein
MFLGILSQGNPVVTWEMVTHFQPGFFLYLMYRVFATGWTVGGSSLDRGKIFRTRPDPAGGPSDLLVQWVPGLSPGGKAARDVALTTQLHPAPRLKKE